LASDSKYAMYGLLGKVGDALCHGRRDTARA
jgi:hypothetical protein